MRFPSLISALVLTATASCGGSSSQQDSQHVDEAARLPSDTEIASLVYDPGYHVPEDFFVDERADTKRSYTVHHVLDSSGSFELCTDDYAQAHAWEEADNASRAVQGYFVTYYENERYFEFVRELSYDDDVGSIGDLTSPGFARVFKCHNTDREGVQRSLLDGYGGLLNTRPLDVGTIRDFAQYLWQFTFFPATYRKVLATFSDQTDNEFAHTLQLAFATRQGADACDQIEVSEWRFAVSRATGKVSRSFDVIRTFEARMTTAGPEICS